MYDLAAFLEPPKDGLAALLKWGELRGRDLFDARHAFPRPFVLHRWWYRDHAWKFL